MSSREHEMTTLSIENAYDIVNAAAVAGSGKRSSHQPNSVNKYTLLLNARTTPKHAAEATEQTGRIGTLQKHERSETKKSRR